MQTIIKTTTVSLLSQCFASFIGNRLSWDPEMSGIGTGLLVLKAAYFNFIQSLFFDHLGNILFLSDVKQTLVLNAV